MKIIAAIAAFWLVLGTAAAQRHRIGISADTPEGALLQQIEQENDEAKKLGLLEQFAEKYPRHEGAAWVYEMQVDAYAKSNRPDQAIAAGEKLLAIDPADLPAAHACLKAAVETKRDPDLTLKWAVIVSDLARKVAATPKPEINSELEDWKARVDFARQLDIYTEYAFYAMALQTPDPKKKVALAETLAGRNPESQYVAQTAEPLFLAYLQTGANDKAVALAEKILAKDQSNAEMLLAVATGYNAKKQPEKALESIEKAIGAMNARPKPEGVSDADWQTRKALVIARAKYLEGVTYAAQEKWPLADQSLRAALPGLANSPDQKAESLFYLGLANYRMAGQGMRERARDALMFSEQCAAMPGSFQAAASTNAKAIRKQYRLP